MFDRTILAGIATKAIRAINRGIHPYAITTPGGEVLQVEGIWQALHVTDSAPDSSDAKQPGNDDYVLKTDPFAPVQPVVDGRFIADGRMFIVCGRASPQGMFSVWPLFKSR